jgi:succinyl-CoA synthetase beta subunit
MLLIEADGKALFAEHGIPIPPTTGPGPWIVKAQVPVGGRGKAGGIVRCTSQPEIDSATARMLGMRLKGHTVGSVLVEQAATGDEHYLSVMVDAASYGLRVIYSATGGIEIEESHSAASRLCAPHAGAVTEALAELTTDPRILAIGTALGSMLLERELALAEINPLFVSPDGIVAGDAKVVVDLNAIPRQPRIAELIAARPDVYQDANRKLAEGFDYVELDPEGEIGLVTTGAGLSMMLIDELTQRGAKPLNFCDIRTGQMRGSPARLIRELEWITARPSLKAVLVNIFAGITDLGEFSRLLVEAIRQVPEFRVPVVARLAGNGLAAAREIFSTAGIALHTDLDEAVAEVKRRLEAA